MKMSPSDQELRAGHRGRLRERFAAEPSSLSDAEILELLLGHVYLRRDNSMLAKRMLHEKGSLAAVFSASADELEEIEGCGASVGKFFLLLREAQARSASGIAMKKASLTLKDISGMAKARLGSLKTEEVWGAFLDRQNRLIVFKKIRSGAADHVLVEPLDVVEQMLHHHASSVVLAHNHPGGGTEPSPEDRYVTDNVSSALTVLGLHLHDHLIVAGDACRSLLQGCLL